MNCDPDGISKWPRVPRLGPASLGKWAFGGWCCRGIVCLSCVLAGCELQNGALRDHQGSEVWGGNGGFGTLPGDCTDGKPQALRSPKSSSCPRLSPDKFAGLEARICYPMECVRKRKCLNLPSFPTVKEPHQAWEVLVNQEIVSLLSTWRDGPSPW